MLLQGINVSATNEPVPFYLDDDRGKPTKFVLSNPWNEGGNKKSVSIGYTKTGKPNLVCTEKFGNGVLGTRATDIYVVQYGSNGYFVSDIVPTYTIKTKNGYYWSVDTGDGSVYGKYSRDTYHRDEWIFTESSNSYGGINIWNAYYGPDAVLAVEGNTSGTVGGLYTANSGALTCSYDPMYNSTGDYFRNSYYTSTYLGLNSSAGKISNQSSLNNNVYVTMTLENAYDCPKSISFGKTSQTLNVGESDPLTTNVQSLWWYTISDEDVISLETTSEGFNIVAKSVGTAVFTFMNKFSGASASITYTVKSAEVLPTSISLSNSKISSVRKTSDNIYTLTATVYPSNATDKTVSWSSTNSTVASVDSYGKVTCKAPGSAVITCTSNSASSVKATCSVSVTQAVTSITVTGSSTMEVGDTQTLSATVSPSNASNKSVTWSSSNTSVATVTSSGYVTAKASGTASITCKAADGNGASKTYYITVENEASEELDMTWVDVTSNNSDLSNMLQSDVLSLTGTLKNNSSSGVYVYTRIFLESVDDYGNENGKYRYVSEQMYHYYAAYSSVTSTHKMSLEDVVPGKYTATLCYYEPTVELWYYTGKFEFPVEVKEATSESCYLSANSATVLKGTSVELPINMTNSVALTSFQFDLYLPDGVKIATDNYGDYEIFVSDTRTSTRKHTVSAAEQSDGAIRILCYSPSNANFSGSTGEVLTINLTTTSSASAGTYKATIKNQTLSTIDLTSYKPSDKTFYVTVKDYILGDVNGDRVVTVVDVTAAVSLALGGGSSNLVREAADINGDGQITVVDVTGIVNIVLTGSSHSPNMAYAGPQHVSKAILVGKEAPIKVCADDVKERKMAPQAGTIAVYIDDCNIDPGKDIQIPILMNNPNDAFTGVQFDMYLPDGLSIVREDDFAIIDIGSRSSSRRHTVSSATQPDGAERILAYSNSNYNFSGESGEILLVTVKADDSFKGGNIMLKNVLLSRSDVTGFEAPDYTAMISTTVGIDGITIDEQTGLDFYDLSGRKISSDSHNKGVVIMRDRNGKTVKVIK